jgi:hypothetical protein
MSKEITKAVLESQVARLAKDAADIQEGIRATERQIQELVKQIDRNHGALSYNAILAASLQKQLEELKAVPDAPPVTG